MNNVDLISTLLDKALYLSTEKETPDWTAYLKKLDEKIVMIDEQIENQIDVPLELQGQFQFELNSLKFENSTLRDSAEKLKARAVHLKESVKREKDKRKSLETRLNKLEARLLTALGMQ